MSNRIATNFDYQANNFLDHRQGKAKTLEELKNWSTPVPEGFELCIGGEWYYYDSTKDLTETGHWVPRIIDKTSNITDPKRQSIGAGVIEEIQGDLGELEGSIKDLDNTIFPVSMGSIVIGSAYSRIEEVNQDRDKWIAEISGNITSQLPYDKRLDWNEDELVDEKDIQAVRDLYAEVVKTKFVRGSGISITLDLGDKILPRIKWKVVRPLVTWKLTPSMQVVWSVVPGTEDNNIPITGSTVTGSSLGIVDSDGLGWTGREILTSDKKATFTYSIVSKVSEKTQVSGSASINFEHRRWTGSGDISIWDKSEINPATLGFSSAFTSSGAMPNTNFNCSGGKYPYILIPKVYYSPSRKTYVNNNLNSDFLIKDVDVVGPNGIIVPCKLYRTTYIQTGSSITIKIE